MISINLNDINMEEIAHRACLFNLTTQNQYRVFGLVPTRLSHVLIEGSDYFHHGDAVFNTRANRVYGFITNMGMLYQFIEHPNHRNPVIKIGLRRDVREHPIFAACLLKTIIYTFEGLLSSMNSTIQKQLKAQMPKLLP